MITVSEVIESARQRGWIPFKECCDLICAKLPDHSSILSGHREGLTGPETVLVYTKAFEAIVALCRDENVLASLKAKLADAAKLLTFNPPFPTTSTSEIDSGPTSDPRVILDSFSRCLARAIARSKSIPPNDGALEQEFRRCRAAWESATIDYDIIAPISGIHPTGFGEVAIAHGLGLAWESVLSENAKHHVDRYADAPSQYRTPIVLVGRRTIKKVANSDELIGAALQDVTQCVTALRLATGRNVGCKIAHILVSESHSRTFNTEFNFVWPLPETTVHGQFLGIGEALTNGDVQIVRDVALLVSGTGGTMLAIALERFNLAWSRHTLEDQVIDLAIALESTLCRGGGTEQVSYRFRVFGAAVLSDKRRADDSMKLLGSLYTARSKVVHAGQRLNSLKPKELLGLTPEQFVADCREVTRCIVLEFLNQAVQGRSPDEYIGDLERAMITSAKATLANEQRT